MIKIAVKSLGLDELRPFVPEKRIIEYLLFPKNDAKLVSMNLIDFANETSSESPAPGGGSVSAYVGSLAVSLATMVANLSSHKRGWDDRWEEFSSWADKGQKIKDKLLTLVDEDTKAFNQILQAFGLPKSSETEKSLRDARIQEATLNAIKVPFHVMKEVSRSLTIIEEMTLKGNPNSLSDAAVGALCARTAILGAHLNVRINSKDIKDKSLISDLLTEAAEIEKNAIETELRILSFVSTKL